VVGMTLAALMCSISRSRRQPVSQIVLEFGLMVAGMLLVAPLAQDIYLIHLAIPLLGVIVAVGGARRLHWSSITLGAAALALYVYLSLPSLRLASHAYYQFYTAPITWPTVLLTGAHTYGVIAVGILTLVTLRWHARVLTAAHGRHARMPEPVPAV
jgi:purine-cytosine permease-like protein